MNVGFIGLGRMGRAMAVNLEKAGHRVRAWNRTRETTADLASKGLSIVSTPDEAFAGDAVIFDAGRRHRRPRRVPEGGLLGRTSTSPIHINMATISVALANEMTEQHKARDIAYVAAPVLGRPDVAAAAKLTIIAAGQPMPSPRCSHSRCARCSHMERRGHTIACKPDETGSEPSSRVGSRDPRRSRSTALRIWC